MTRSSSPIDEYSYDFPTSLRPPPFHHRPPTSKAADISRILDPSYASPSYSTAVYVDHQGNLHDPDYRPFPTVLVNQKPRRTSSPIPRPRWELADEDALDDDDDDDDATSYYSSRVPTYHTASRRSSSLSRTKHHSNVRDSFSTFNRPSSTYSPTYSHPNIHPSPPTSYESDDAVLLEADESPFADEQDEKKHVISRRYTATKAKHRVSKSLERSSPKSEYTNSRSRSQERSSTVEEVDEKQERRLPYSSTTSYIPSRYISTTTPIRTSISMPHAPPALIEDDVDDATPEWTPTCSQSMRRQWQAISLRFRFGLFRTQRKIKRRVHSIL